MMLALANSPLSVLVDANAHVRIMKFPHWSRVGDCIATHLIPPETIPQRRRVGPAAAIAQQEEDEKDQKEEEDDDDDDTTTSLLFLEQVVLSLSEAFVRERRYYVRHLNGNVWDYCRDNLRLEAIQPSAFAGVSPTLHSHMWFVTLAGCKNTSKKPGTIDTLSPLVAVCQTELEAAFVYNQARGKSGHSHASKASKTGKAGKWPALNVVQKFKQDAETQRQLACWSEGHAHTVQVTGSALPRNAQGVAFLRVYQPDGQEAHLLVDDDAHARLTDSVRDWPWLCGALYHPRKSLEALALNPAAPHIAGTAIVHCNGDPHDFRRANLILADSYRPATAAMRQSWLFDRHNHYVRLSEDGQHVTAAKGAHLTHHSGPYPPHVTLWAAHQVRGKTPCALASACAFFPFHPTR
jgi:hypothetical protein